MDDQFNGRTDDDLFADDFEPIEAQREALPKTTDKSPPPVIEQEPQPTSSEEPPIATPQTVAANTPRSLAQSRHATKPAASSQPQPRPRKQSPKPAAATTTTPISAEPQPQQESPGKVSTGSTGSGNGDNASNSKKTAQSSPAKPGQNTALADRLASGANPRTKLTESELAAKMEEMRLLAAEKTRRFEQAERDSRSHAAAYEKGMEEARKRRADDAERRRKGAEERRRMDEERAANRERKLKAMGAKEGGSWDEGKNVEEERERRAVFRSANGGVRGVRNNNGGMASSRFAERDTDAVPREFGPDDFRGRGRGGRGRGGSTRGAGRGGREGFNNDSRPAATARNGTAPQKQKPNQAPPTADDFPALPATKPVTKKLDTTTKTTYAANLPFPSPGPDSPPIGKWDDEMAALDAKTKA
ncbi:hypothetical protein F4804DRAFT_320260 [Jackrogersella minutella]|nr:hypothetical protein F4804DRAFT_320260 [Jackrogersella minutella]